MASDDTVELQRRLREFAAERDWDQFHTPKNLAMAIAAEAGELLDVFRWLTPDEAAAVMGDPKLAEDVKDELADVGIFLLRLADVLDIDLTDAIRHKISRNEARFPADDVRGRHDLPPAT